MNFSQVKAITIPEGAVKQITDGLGRVLWGSGPIVDYTEPFYVESRGEAVGISIKKVSSSAPDIPVEYSFDKTTWQSLGSTSTEALTINISPGGKVWLRASATQWATSSSYYNHIIASSRCNVGGNIMSLLYGDTFTGQHEFPSTTISYIFSSLFQNSTTGIGNIVDASKLLLPATTLVNYCYYSMFYRNAYLTTTPELPAVTLTERCYSYMFSGCTSLTQAPELPAVTLAERCYSAMFSGCTSLTQAPELPATTLANYCYSGMFDGCTSLTQAPELPAVTLAERCYNTMFRGCTSLTQAPELPATTLANYCYSTMFSGCTALTQAPELPATTLANYCYSGMFDGCRNLNYIKCLGTNPSTSYSNNWLRNVASTGTFIKKAGVSWPTGTSGIPSGWTVVQE